MRAYLKEELPEHIGRGKHGITTLAGDLYLTFQNQRIRRLGPTSLSRREVRQAVLSHFTVDLEPDQITPELIRRKMMARKEALGAQPQSFAKYEKAIKLLDPQMPLSRYSIEHALAKGSAPFSQHRRLLANFLKSACDVFDQPWHPDLDVIAQKGQSIQRQELPFFSDKEIEAQLKKDLSPSWRRTLVLLAAYGLRPWETLIAVPCERYKGNVWIGKGKKVARGETKPRSVPPFHPEWFQQLDVESLLIEPPPLTNLRHAGTGIQHHFKRKAVLTDETRCYGWRHAYARRMHLHHGISAFAGALFMGHSERVHMNTYNRFIEGAYDPYAQISAQDAA